MNELIRYFIETQEVERNGGHLAVTSQTGLAENAPPAYAVPFASLGWPTHELQVVYAT